MSTQSASSLDRDALREKERQARAQLLEEMRDPSPQPIFGEPIKVDPAQEDETSRRVKSTLGDFTQVQHYLISDPKHLIGISRSASAATHRNGSAPTGTLSRSGSSSSHGVAHSSQKKHTLLNGQHKSSNSSSSHSSACLPSLSSNSSKPPETGDTDASHNSQAKPASVTPPPPSASVPNSKQKSKRNSKPHQQEEARRDKPETAASEVEPTSSSNSSKAIGRKPSSKRELPNGVSRKKKHQHTSDKLAAARQSLSKLTIPEPAVGTATSDIKGGVSTDNQAEVENILREMKLPVPPPLTAIETPRKEEAKFQFSPFEAMDMAYPFTGPESADVEAKRDREAALSPFNLREDLAMSDSDEESIPLLMKEGRGPPSDSRTSSHDFVHPPLPLAGAHSSSDSTSSDSDESSSVSDSEESDSSDGSNPENASKPSMQSWGLANFMDRRNSSPALAPLGISNPVGNVSTSNEHPQPLNGHSLHPDKEGTFLSLADEDYASGNLSKCSDQDVKSLNPSQDLEPEVAITDTITTGHTLLSPMKSPPVHQKECPLVSPNSSPLLVEHDEGTEEEHKFSPRSKWPSYDSEGKVGSCQVRNGIIKIRLSKPSAKSHSSTGPGETLDVEKSSRVPSPVSAGKIVCTTTSGKNSNMQVTASTTHTPSTVPSSALTSANIDKSSSKIGKNNKHSSKLSKESKDRHKNTAVREEKGAELAPSVSETRDPLAERLGVSTKVTVTDGPVTKLSRHSSKPTRKGQLPRSEKRVIPQESEAVAKKQKSQNKNSAELSSGSSNHSPELSDIDVVGLASPVSIMCNEAKNAPASNTPRENNSKSSTTVPCIPKLPQKPKAKSKGSAKQSSLPCSVTEIINRVATGEVLFDQKTDEPSKIKPTEVVSSLPVKSEKSVNSNLPNKFNPPELLSPLSHSGTPQHIREHQKENTIPPSVIVSIDLSYLDNVPQYPPSKRPSYGAEKKAEIRTEPCNRSPEKQITRESLKEIKDEPNRSVDDALGECQMQGDRNSKSTALLSNKASSLPLKAKVAKRKTEDERKGSEKKLKGHSKGLNQKTDKDRKEQYSSDYYLSEAKKLKHQADKETDRTAQAMKYLEAVLYFILTGNAMEHNRVDTDKVYTMYKETLNLIRHISSKFHKLQTSSTNGCIDSKLAVLSLRCQALLYLKLYCLRKAEVRDLHKTWAEFQKSSAGRAAVHSSPLLPSHQTPTSRLSHSSPCQPRGGSNGANGIPSPHSPTPSPAGSVASVGSQSSGYSSSELNGIPSKPLASSNTTLPAGGLHNSSSNSSSCLLTSGSGAQHQTAAQQQAIVSLPQQTFGVIQRLNSHFTHLHMCHDLWEQADNLLSKGHSKELFTELDECCGRLTLQSSFSDLVHYVRAGLHRLKDNT